MLAITIKFFKIIVFSIINVEDDRYMFTDETTVVPASTPPRKREGKEAELICIFGKPRDVPTLPFVKVENQKKPQKASEFLSDIQKDRPEAKELFEGFYVRAKDEKRYRDLCKVLIAKKNYYLELNSKEVMRRSLMTSQKMEVINKKGVLGRLLLLDETVEKDDFLNYAGIFTFRDEGDPLDWEKSDYLAAVCLKPSNLVVDASESFNLSAFMAHGPSKTAITFSKGWDKKAAFESFEIRNILVEDLGIIIPAQVAMKRIVASKKNKKVVLTDYSSGFWARKGICPEIVTEEVEIIPKEVYQYNEFVSEYNFDFPGIPKTSHSSNGYKEWAIFVKENATRQKEKNPFLSLGVKQILHLSEPTVDQHLKLKRKPFVILNADVFISSENIQQILDKIIESLPWEFKGLFQGYKKQGTDVFANGPKECYIICKIVMASDLYLPCIPALKAKGISSKMFDAKETHENEEHPVDVEFRLAAPGVSRMQLTANSIFRLALRWGICSLRPGLELSPDRTAVVQKQIEFKNDSETEKTDSTVATVATSYTDIGFQPALLFRFETMPDKDYLQYLERMAKPEKTSPAELLKNT